MTENYDHQVVAGTTRRGPRPLWIFALIGFVFLRFVAIPQWSESRQMDLHKVSSYNVDSIGRAVMEYRDEQGHLPQVKTGKAIDLAPYLVPKYLEQIRGVDGYGNTIEYQLMNQGKGQTFQVISHGLRGKKEPDPFKNKRYEVSCLENDLVWMEGRFASVSSGELKVCEGLTWFETLTGLRTL